MRSAKQLTAPREFSGCGTVPVENEAGFGGLPAESGETMKAGVHRTVQERRKLSRENPRYLQRVSFEYPTCT